MLLEDDFPDKMETKLLLKLLNGDQNLPEH